MTKPTAKDTAEYIGVVILVRLLRALSAKASLRLGAFLGKVTFDVFRFRRKVTLSNLRNRSPGDSAGLDPIEVGRGSYVSFGMGIAEFARLPGVDIGYLQRNMEIDGLAHLDDVRSRGRGAVLVTGHFGSWELLGCALVRLGYPVKFVIGVQRNPLVQNLMNQIRHASGIETIELHRSMEILRALRRNQFIALLSDQDAGRKGVFVSFLGQQASTPQGPARLSLMVGSPIVPGFIVRVDGLRHRIVIEKPIYPDRDEDSRAAVITTTQAYTRVIEAYVRRYPDHWLWAHRRWKTRPD